MLKGEERESRKERYISSNLFSGSSCPPMKYTSFPTADPVCW